MPGHGQDGPRRLAETVARQSDLTYVPQVPIGRKPPSVQIDSSLFVLSRGEPVRPPCQERKGGGFAAAVFAGRAAPGYGAVPPASRLLRIACGDGLTAGLDPGASTAPGGRKSGRPGPAPGARGTQTQSGGAGERVLGGGARA